MNKTEIKLSHRITALEDKISEILAEIVTLETKMDQRCAGINMIHTSLDHEITELGVRMDGYHPQPPTGESA